MARGDHRHPRGINALSLACALLLGLIGPASAESPKGYRDPDPKIIAQAETIAGALKAAPSRKKRKVLVYGISFGPHRFVIPTARKVFTLLGEKTGAFEAVVSEDLAHFEPEPLKQFDAVIFANTTGDVFCRPADHAAFKALPKAEQEKQKKIAGRLVKNLDDYLRAGGGFVGIHAATDTLKKHEAYAEMIGGVFWQHPWGPRDTVRVRVEDPGHALVQGVFEKPEFAFHDEIYEFREPYDRKKLRILLSLNLATSDKPNRPLRRTDGDYAVAWVRRHGDGRVFYCSLGHATSTYANPAILTFWLRGIQFATGDLDAATDPVKE
jgi:type 1 glutamine amidotransferase